MADARSYRPGASGPSTTAGAPSAAVDRGFVDPQSYDEYLNAARRSTLPPGSPANPANLAHLDAIATANPGITPDGAVAALATGLPATDPSVQQIAAMTTEQRAARIASLLQAAARDRQQDGNNGAEGLIKSLSRTVFNAAEAPFQLGQNAIAYGMGKVAGEQPDGVGIGDVFTNTDLGNEVYGVQDGLSGSKDTTYQDQGDSYFTSPDSSSAKVKEGLDNDLRGGLGATLGQALANSLNVQKGTTAYSILSGTVDASSRVFDPTMYVGAGEVKAAVRSAQGIDAAKGAKALEVGSAAAAADDAAKQATAHAGTAYDAAAAADREGARASTLEQELEAARKQELADIDLRVGPARHDAAVAAAKVDSLVADHIGTSAEQTLEAWRQQALEADAALKATEHEARTAITDSITGHETAAAMRDAMLAEGHMLPEAPAVAAKPLPEGFKIGEPEEVHLAPPKPRDTRTEVDWTGSPNLKATPGEDTATVRRIMVHDADGNPAAQLYFHADDGFIEDIAVRPDLRRQGLATKLFDAATEWANRNGAHPPMHATDPADFSDSGAAWRSSVESRNLDEGAIKTEAQARHDAEQAAHADVHGDAEASLVALLSPIQKAQFHKTGLFPLSVLRKHMADGTLGSAGTEELSALVRSGTRDIEQDYAEHGSSKPIGDWESEAQFYPGKTSGPKYVKVPWKMTKDDLASSLEKHTDDVRQEAIAAGEEARINPTVKMLTASDAAATPALVEALGKIAPNLASEFGIPLEVFTRATGKTPAAVVNDIARRLTEAGTNEVTKTRILYSLNDDLMSGAGVVVDGAAGLAPAGRGRAAAEQHALAEAHLENVKIQSDQFGQTIGVMQGLSDEAKAALKKLDERPIQSAGKAADRAQARADSLGAQAAKKQAARIASLQRRLDEVNGKVAEHTANRDEAIAAMKVLTDEVAKKAGVGGPPPAAGDPNAMIQYLHDVAGLRRTADGTDVADLDKGIAYLTGTDAEPLYRAVAALDDKATIYNLTRGKLPVDMVGELAAAKTVDEARAVFIRYVGRGMVDPTTGKLRALRIAGRAAMNGTDPETMLSKYAKAFDVAAAATKWGTEAGRRNVPWASSRHIEDHEGMVNLASDTLNYMERLWRPTRNEAGRAFHDEWVTKMLDAGTSEARRTVWYQMLDATATRAAKAQGLSDEATEAFVGSLKASMARQRSLTSYTAEARAANGGVPLTLNGQPLPKNIAMLEAEMSTRVMTPDWREMRRALKSAQSLERAAGANPELRRAALEASDAVFDKFWRTSVLAFRGGYVIRNTADIAARMYLTGHPSLFTSPQGIAAMALSHHIDPNSALGALVNRAERADLDVTGKPFEKVADEEKLYSEAIDGFNRVAARDTSLLDPGSPGRAMRLGEVPVGPDHHLFFRGWANELGKMWASPMAADVLKVVTGRSSKALRDHMKLTGITDRREALVDYLTAGAGKARLDRLRDLSPTLSEKITTRDDLYAYLFGDEAVSLASRWQRLTMGLDPQITEHVMGHGVADTMPDTQAVKAATSFLEKRDETAALLRGVSKDAIKDPSFPVQEVNAPVWADRGAGNAFAQKAEQATDAFFTMSSHIEKNLGYLPEFRYAKWDRTAQLMRALSPEDAAKVLAVAEETLGGGFLGSWSKRTLSDIRSAAKGAAGDGGFTIDDLKHVTDEYGVRQVRDLFYDAQKRNALGHATRLVSPFAQAWANSLKVWGRLAVQNPRQVYKAALLYRAGQGPGTAWLTDDPSNPDDALFYKDPQTGVQMVGIPVAGTALAALGSLVSKAQGGDMIDPGSTGAASPVSSFNLLFQNGMLPGVGPAISVPASMLDSSDTYQAAVPDYLKRALVPYTNVDPDRDPGVLEAALPGWFGTVLAGAGVPGFSERVTKYVKPAMSSLFSQHPERYLNEQGFMDNDAQARLLRDANALAHGITFGKGLLQNSSAGSLQPELFVKDRNGNSLAQPILSQEFSDLTTSTGSREAAMSALMDKYGVEPLLTMLPNREFGYQPTDQAYQFVKDNPDVADAHGSVLSLFLPGGGYSAYMDRWARKRGNNPAMDPGQMIDYSNGLLYEAQVGQLDKKLVQGQLTQDQYDAATKTLKDEYKDVPQAQRTMNGRDVAVSEIKDALTAPVLGKTEAGHAADVYLRLRDQALASAGGGALTGKGDAPLRAWLRQQGEELTIQYPEFLVMWTKVFRGEVKD